MLFRSWEVDDASGVQINGGIIGLRRDRLIDSKELDLIETAFHEYGHEKTGAGDYDRDFASFFIKRIAEENITTYQSLEIGRETCRERVKMSDVGVQ